MTPGFRVHLGPKVRRRHEGGAGIKPETPRGGTAVKLYWV